MPPPINRAGMEHNMYLLSDEMQQNINNKDFIANRLWALSDSIEHLRLLPNGRIELSTIDEKVRSIANMMDWLKYLPPVLKTKK